MVEKTDFDDLGDDDEVRRRADENVIHMIRPFTLQDWEAAHRENQARDLHKDLMVGTWRSRVLPPRDWLIEGLICTTSRVMLVGESGIGKTLFGIDLAHALASGGRFVNWVVKRPCRIMYLDGELPAETVQDRVRAAARIYPDAENVIIFNRDLIPERAMPPLNTEAGTRWLFDQVELFRPDLIFFDSIMCLTNVDLKEAKEWQPVRILMHRLTGMRIAQIWMHHTGIDASRSYGDKSKEWDLDTVGILNRPDEADPQYDSKIELRWTKTRMKDGSNARLYEPMTMQRFDTGWGSSGKPPPRSTKRTSSVDDMSETFLQAFDLCDGDRGPDHIGHMVKKVALKTLQAVMKRRGWLQCDEDRPDRVTAADRKAFSRAQRSLEKRKIISIDSGMVWRLGV